MKLRTLALTSCAIIAFDAPSFSATLGAPQVVNSLTEMANMGAGSQATPQVLVNGILYQWYSLGLSAAYGQQHANCPGTAVEPGVTPGDPYIAATGVATTSCWVRSNPAINLTNASGLPVSGIANGVPYITPEQYGFVNDGSSADLARFVAARTAAEASGSPFELVGGKTYNMYGPITIDQGKSDLICNHATLDFSSKADGAWVGVTLTASNSKTPGDRGAAFNLLSKTDGCEIVGPGKAGSGAAYSMTSVGLKIVGENVFATNGSVYGWGTGLLFHNVNSYLNRLDSFSFYQNGAGVKTLTGGSNSGENMVISNSRIADNYVGIDWAMGLGSRLSMPGTSIDYNAYRAINCAGSATLLLGSGSWYETGDAGVGNYTYNNNGCVLQFDHTTILQGGIPGAPYAQAAFGHTTGGGKTIFSHVASTNTVNTAQSGAGIWDDGDGTVTFQMDPTASSAQVATIVSISANRFSDPNFTDATFPDRWWVSDASGCATRLTCTSGQITQSTSEHYGTATASLMFNKTGGGVSATPNVVIPLPGNSFAGFRCYYKIPAGSNGAPVFVYMVAAEYFGVNSLGVPVLGKTQSYGFQAIGGTTGLVDWTSLGWLYGSLQLPQWSNALYLTSNADGFGGILYFSNCAANSM